MNLFCSWSSVTSVNQCNKLCGVFVHTFQSSHSLVLIYEKLILHFVFTIQEMIGGFLGRI